MDRTQKEKQVEYISDRFEKAKSIIFADFRGLNVTQITELRRKLSEAHAEMKVVKNRLTKRAAKNRNIEGLDEHLTGPTAMTSTDTDPVLPAKILVNFAKDHDALQIKAGFMDGRVLDLGIIRMLASLPSREVLLSKALGSLMAPITKFTLTLAAIPKNLVNVINAINPVRKNGSTTNSK